MHDADVSQQECQRYQAQIRELIAKNEELRLDAENKQEQLPILIREVEDLQEENKMLRSEQHIKSVFHGGDA